METKQDKMSFSELRRRAQDFLAKQPDDSEKPDLSSEDVQRLIHELDTHQIELELQNEDLRRAQEELVKSQRRYADLYDFAPVAYFTLDEQAKILEVNLTAAEMLGVPRAQLLGRFFTDFIAPKTRKYFISNAKNCWSPGRDSPTTCGSGKSKVGFSMPSWSPWSLRKSWTRRGSSA